MIHDAARIILVGSIRLYQLCLRPVLGPNCRFVPSCSDYALTAVGRHGVRRGSWLAAARILRCNPWHAGGHDPVPAAGHARGTPRPHSHCDRPSC